MKVSRKTPLQVSHEINLTGAKKSYKKKLDQKQKDEGVQLAGGAQTAPQKQAAAPKTHEDSNSEDSDGMEDDENLISQNFSNQDEDDDRKDNNFFHVQVCTPFPIDTPREKKSRGFKSGEEGAHLSPLIIPYLSQWKQKVSVQG